MKPRDIAVGFGATMLIAGPVALYAAYRVELSRSEQPPENYVRPPEPALTPTPRPSPPPRKKTQRETLAEFNLEKAMMVAKPSIEPLSTGNGQDKGTMMMTVWAAVAMRWKDVQVAKDETTSALVKKDAQAEVGKRLCVRGSVIEIYVKHETLDDGKPLDWATGTISAHDGALYRFFAAGSTGKLVENSPARFCGVVTGLLEYESMARITMQAVKVVGMFDLPENH